MNRKTLNKVYPDCPAFISRHIEYLITYAFDRIFIIESEICSSLCCSFYIYSPENTFPYNCCAESKFYGKMGDKRNRAFQELQPLIFFVSCCCFDLLWSFVIKNLVTITERGRRFWNSF